MRIKCLCTARGLIPLYDEDFDNKKRLKVGETYDCDVKLNRNYELLQKAHTLVNAAWSIMNENDHARWRSKDGFRDCLTVAAGFYDVYYNPRLQQFVEEPRS